MNIGNSTAVWEYLWVRTEFAVDKLLHVHGRGTNVIVDAGVAMAIIISFHRIQHWGKHEVDHTFFHLWHAAAEALRHFLDKAAHITAVDILQTRFVVAVDLFTGQSGAALYLRNGQQGLRRCESSIDGAPVYVDINHEVVVSLRYARKEVDAESLGGQLAFPMMVRGHLAGMLLVGAKAHGQQYRPDELTLLASSAHQLGLDLASLRIDTLERQSFAASQEAAAVNLRLAAAETRASSLEETAAARTGSCGIEATDRWIGKCRTFRLARPHPDVRQTSSQATDTAKPARSVSVESSYEQTLLIWSYPSF